jgi:hypothetical protein
MRYVKKNFTFPKTLAYNTKFWEHILGGTVFCQCHIGSQIFPVKISTKLKRACVVVFNYIHFIFFFMKIHCLKICEILPILGYVDNTFGLTPWNKSLLENLRLAQLVRNKTRKFTLQGKSSEIWLGYLKMRRSQ